MSTDLTYNQAQTVTLFERARAKQLRRKRTDAVIFALLFSVMLIMSLYIGEVSLSVFWEGLPGLFNYVNDTLPEIHRGSVFADVGKWYWALGRWLSLLLDTILIAFLGTVLGVSGALIISFPASRNLMKISWVYFIARRLMEIARGVPEIVYAMIFVFSFGLGPFPGVLAITIHCIGALGKLFSEVNENIDPNPVEGVKASGANWLLIIRYAVLPQVLPNFLSYALLRFEINVRAATVIGFVGAGGIGQELMFVIRQFVYQDISALVLMIMLTVALIDISCEKLRQKMIGKESLI